MLQLLLLLQLLVPLGLLHALCGESVKKKRGSHTGTGRSFKSRKSSSPGAKSNDELLRTAVDSAGGGRLPMGDENEGGTNEEKNSGRISIHGTVHNTDTFQSAEPVDGDCKMPSIEGGIDPEKAA
ncbi:hypothetical protein PMAYCL1PPCAC_11660, partial [Pristionchus mayeri]